MNIFRRRTVTDIVASMQAMVTKLEKVAARERDRIDRRRQAIATHYQHISNHGAAIDAHDAEIAAAEHVAGNIQALINPPKQDAHS